MLTIVVPASEFFNNKTQEFINTKEQVLKLEHSLVSISKWEAKYKKSFFGNKEKTSEEMLDYIKFMTLTQNVDPNTYLGITQKNLDDIVAYINDPMTATRIMKHGPKKASNKYVSSEEIYYWMFSYNIPKECEKWHFNRLSTLIDIFNTNNSKGDKDSKMSEDEIHEYNAKRNAEMRAKYQSKG